MRPEEGDPAHLWDMREAARETPRFLAGADLAAFLTNRGLRLIVERELEIVGEAARRVSSAFRSAHPEVPWAGIIGQRNIIAHEYGDIDPARLWAVATERLPLLVLELGRLIAEARDRPSASSPDSPR